MSNLSQPQIETAIKAYIDPYLDKDLVSAGCIKDIAIDGGQVKVRVGLGFPAAGYHQTLVTALKDTISAL